MAENSEQEKTEAPTGKRLELAKEQGQVPRSRELGTFLLLLVGASTLWAMGGWLSQRFMKVMHQGLRVDPGVLRDPQMALAHMGDLSLSALLSFAPFFALLVFAALLPPFLLNAFVIAPGTIAPDLSRLNPLAGIGRMFSWQGVAEMLKSAFKALLIGGTAVLVIWYQKEAMLALLVQPLQTAMVQMGGMLTFSFLMIVLSMALIVAADVPFQLWQYYDKLKMTQEEVKQEMKQSEGDPMLKGKIRSLQRAAARRRMMTAVPTANVIVTNPTHFAVALSYTEGMSAPKVVAKGIGLVAQRIKQIGAEHGVPLLEAPPLARALFKHVELEAAVPAALYEAVAQVLAYVHQLNQWRKTGGAQPRQPQNLSVPDEFMVPEAT